MAHHVPRALVAMVRERAACVFEFCRLPQRFQEALFHLDHVVPRSVGGPTHADNLAVACVTCSLRKAARLDARDPSSAELAPLFNPRREFWSEHFRWSRGGRLVGRTATGRATIRALGMNRPAIIAIRRLMAKLDKLNRGIGEGG